MSVVINFTKGFHLQNGDPRQQFEIWTMPKDEVQTHRLRDGMSFRGRVQFGNRRRTFEADLTSGCEFHIGRELAAEIKNAHTDISFTLSF